MKREVKVQYMLNHNNILRLFNHFEDDDYLPKDISYVRFKFWLRCNTRIISQMLNATIFKFKDIIHVNTRSNFVIPPTLHRHCCFPASLFNYVLHTAI